MEEERKSRIAQLINKIPSLTDGQLYWLAKILQVFNCYSKYEIQQSDLLDRNTLEQFGDALRIHHSFSIEPFSKDKFEYVLEQTLRISGQSAKLAPKGNRGHDITVIVIRFRFLAFGIGTCLGP
ncbi:MAG: hypothetical protein HQK57_01980 [Deltaproteobacteria bacterium]|nr:hypothetical protein [Deltaproteobacteria bacterium]